MTAKSQIDISELKRLFVEERLNTREIAKRLGLSRQRISARFAQAGLSVGKLKKMRKHPLADAVRELMTVERLSKHAAAKRLAVSNTTVTVVAKQLRIKRNMISSRKFPALNSIKIGEHIDVPAGKTIDQNYRQFYKIGARLGIKLSVSRLDDRTMRVTRIE